MTDNRTKQFKADIQSTRSVVVCVKCGSTVIDQNFSTQLKCYNCGNVSIWDASRFTIARDGQEDDATRGFQNATKEPATGWHPSIVGALLPMLHRITEMPSVGSSGKIGQSDYTELAKLWQQAKHIVDATLAKLPESGVSPD